MYGSRSGYNYAPKRGEGWSCRRGLKNAWREGCGREGWNLVAEAEVRVCGGRKEYGQGWNMSECAGKGVAFSLILLLILLTTFPSPGERGV